MKLLMTVFDLNDYGGIVTQVEIIKRGLEKLGHTCDFIILRNVDRFATQKKESTHIAGSYKSRVGNQANTISGWYGVTVIGYGSKACIRQWKEWASDYDGIIHQIPVPKPDQRGLWRRVYDIDVPQIAVIHDAHFPMYYPHLIDVADRLQGIAATNHAQYNATAAFPGRRALIPTAHIIKGWDDELSWKKRAEAFVSAHVWKRWKHMDRVLRALPYLDRRISNVIGGDGIEARYMRSTEKCKEEYRGLWKTSLRKGRMDYRGLMTHRELLKEYARARCMVDLSFSKAFQPYGAHPNRALLEAINSGCIPVMTKENMQGWVFKHGEHLWLVRHERSPKAVAEAIEHACTMHRDEAGEMIEAGRALLRTHFEYKHCARSYVRLLQGKASNIGMVPVQRGRLTVEIQTARDKLIDKVEG